MTDHHPPTGQYQPRPHYQAAPGWYADPSGAACWRYFDGHQWTDHVHVAEIHQRQPQAAVVRPIPHDQSQAATATPDRDRAWPDAMNTLKEPCGAVRSGAELWLHRVATVWR
jgi:hypothetical protein